MGTMSLTEIMDRSIEILKKYIKTIVTFNLAYIALCLVGVVGVVLIGVILVAIVIGLKLSPVVIGIVSTILGIGLFTFAMCFKIGLIKISSQEFFEERIDAGKAISFSMKKIFKVLGVLLMEVLMFLPVAGIFAVIGYIGYSKFQNSSLFLGMNDKNEITIIVITIVIILLFFLSLLAYVTIFSFSFHAVAIENKGVFAALKRSYALVKGDYFKILGCTILFNLTIYAITSSLQSFIGIVAAIIYTLFKFLNIQQDLLAYATMMYNILQWPISLLSGLVISPLLTIMMTHLYYNQRFKKEGYDILLKLNKIEKDYEKGQLCEGNQYGDTI
ncbi:hypothetical protein [Clostridium sp.]